MQKAEFGNITAVKIVNHSVVSWNIIPDIAGAIEKRMLDPPECCLLYIKSDHPLTARFIIEFNDCRNQQREHVMRLPTELAQMTSTPLSDAFVSVLIADTHDHIFGPVNFWNLTARNIAQVHDDTPHNGTSTSHYQLLDLMSPTKMSFAVFILSGHE